MLAVCSMTRPQRCVSLPHAAAINKFYLRMLQRMRRRVEAWPAVTLDVPPERLNDTLSTVLKDLMAANADKHNLAVPITTKAEGLVSLPGTPTVTMNLVMGRGMLLLLVRLPARV